MSLRTILLTVSDIVVPLRVIELPYALRREVSENRSWSTSFPQSISVISAVSSPLPRSSNSASAESQVLASLLFRFQFDGNSFIRFTRIRATSSSRAHERTTASRYKPSREWPAQNVFPPRHQKPGSPPHAPPTRDPTPPPPPNEASVRRFPVFSVCWGGVVAL